MVPTVPVGPPSHPGPIGRRSWRYPARSVAGAIFVVAGASRGQQGPVAALVSTAGWAGAAQRVLGRAWIATPNGVIDPTDLRRLGSDPALRSEPARLRRRVPTPAKTAVKDLRSWRRARQFRVDVAGPWSASDVAFVWQRHDLFQDAGLRLARDLGVPSVLFVPATVVWEARQWGTHRPGWGRWLERRGEGPTLNAADLVACGTDAVAEQVRRLGVPDERVVSTPTGVDLDLFHPAADPARLRHELGLEHRFVVGWVGSFRRFHALEQAVEAMVPIDGATLLLVGDGPERLRIDQLARARGVPTVFTGTVDHDALPIHLAAMDAAVLLAPPGAPFHYSPLKLAEYLAAGVPVVAPAVGQLLDRLTDEEDALLVPPNDRPALTAALLRLRDDGTMRERLGRAGRATAAATWSWDHQVRRVLSALAP